MYSKVGERLHELIFDARKEEVWRKAQVVALNMQFRVAAKDVI